MSVQDAAASVLFFLLVLPFFKNVTGGQSERAEDERHKQTPETDWRRNVDAECFWNI